MAPQNGYWEACWDIRKGKGRRKGSHRGKNRGLDFDAIDAKDPSLLDEIAEYFDYESKADLIYELTDIYELVDSSELCAWFFGSIEDEGEGGEELLERLENILD